MTAARMALTPLLVSTSFSSVDDFDDLVARIADRGLEPTQRETHPNGVRKVVYHDPDGNEIGFGGAPM